MDVLLPHSFMRVCHGFKKTHSFQQVERYREKMEQAAQGRQQLREVEEQNAK